MTCRWVFKDMWAGRDHDAARTLCARRTGVSALTIWSKAIRRFVCQTCPRKKTLRLRDRSRPLGSVNKAVIENYISIGIIA